MRRGTNPIAVILLIVVGILGLIVGWIVKGMLPEAIASWGGLVFWLVFIAVAFLGGTIIGKKFGNRRR